MNIIEVALSQLNTKEKQLNDIIFNTWYYKRAVQGGSYPYCAVFISWCANKADIPTDVIPCTASVKTMYSFFVSQGAFHDIGTYTPQPGDLMIQRSNGASHVGLVLQADKYGFVTVEGNSGIGVQICNHSYYDNTITGFASPKYIEKLEFDLEKFADGVDGETMNSAQIWSWFKSKGYDNYTTAGMVATLSQIHSFNSDWDIKEYYGTAICRLGIFGLDWGDSGENTTESDYKDWKKMYATHADSRIGHYITWCNQRSLQYNSAVNQLEYFWYCVQNNTNGLSALSPGNLNNTTENPTVEQAEQVIVNSANALKSVLGYDDLDSNRMLTTAKGLYEANKENTAESTVTPTVVTGDQPMRVSSTVGSVNTVGSYTYIDYTVKDGDTLESIAEAFNITPQMILFANNLTSWGLSGYVGKTLKIPQISTILSKEEAVSGVNSITPPEYYSVVTVSHPTAEVEFRGEYGKLAAKTTIGKTEYNTEMDNDIITLSTNRSLRADCPTFTMTLVWRNKWFDNIASNDLVIIKMYRNGEDHNTVMYGLVDDIRRGLDWSSGQPKRVVRISGRGVNKAFCLFTIGMLENFDIGQHSRGWFDNFFSLAMQTSAGCIKIVIDSYLGKGLNYRFGDSSTESTLKSLKDLIAFELIDNKEKLIDYQSFTSFSGSLWNFIKELENAPFNETFWEIKNDKPTLVHRPTPFLKDRWIQLPCHTIKDRDLASNDTGRGDMETYTLFQANIRLDGSQTKNLFWPVWYPPYYSKYGLRKMVVSSIYSANNGANTEFEPKQFTQDLFNFYIKNNVMENGSLSVKGSGKYHIGERVILESENMEYYVEGVSQSFNMYTSWVTNLQVTRGLHPEDRFTPPYGAGEDLTATILNAIINWTGGGTLDWSNLPPVQYATSSSTYAGRSGSMSTSSKWYMFHGIYFTHPSPDCSYVSSSFGNRQHPTSGEYKMHNGIDLCLPSGDSTGTPIYAAADGTVIQSGAGEGYGYWIEIDHGDGITTRYAHMYSQDLLVSTGRQVTAGQQISRVGSSGDSTGAHLHFELRVNGIAVDPQANLFDNPVAAPAPKSVAECDSGNHSPNAVAQDVYRFLTGIMGLNKGAACAVLGNIQQESGFIINNENSIGAYGLCQWLDRRDALEQYCMNNGFQINSVTGQMSFFRYELETTESPSYSVLLGIGDSKQEAMDGAVRFGQAFERYGSGEEGKRRQYAGEWYDYF